MGVSQNRGKTPKMDGGFFPYFLGWYFTPYFRKPSEKNKEEISTLWGTIRSMWETSRTGKKIPLFGDLDFFQPKRRTIGALNKQGLGNGNRFQPI